ncbi:MAG: hypothetical protein AAGD96_29645 [Chloroflexota bacterium]
MFPNLDPIYIILIGVALGWLIELFVEIFFWRPRKTSSTSADDLQKSKVKNSQLRLQLRLAARELERIENEHNRLHINLNDLHLTGQDGDEDYERTRHQRLSFEIDRSHQQLVRCLSKQKTRSRFSRHQVDQIIQALLLKMPQKGNVSVQVAQEPQSAAIKMLIGQWQQFLEGHFGIRQTSKNYEPRFKVSTKLIGEKEIDIDDREAKILFTVELVHKPDDPINFQLENVGITLHVDNDPKKRHQSIEIEGVTNGDVVIFSQQNQHTLSLESPLRRMLTIRTGAFSSQQRDTPSAVAGLKHYPLTIAYTVVPTDKALGRAQEIMQFAIGRD